MMSNKISLFAIGFLFSMFLIYSTQYSFGDTGVITIDSHDVKYDIANGNVESIFLDPDFFELLVTMNTHADGTIDITFPRELLDAKFELSDDMFYVLVDGFETTYIESESNPNSRTLAIPFFNGDSTIEIIGTHALNPFISNTEIIIPDWIKNNAGWWSKDLIKDSDFVSGIQYLIKEKIMTIPSTSSGGSSNEAIPDWIKNNAGWWSKDLIKDSDFVSGIQYLITNGIMHV
jgi:hypothetical protein